MPYGQVLVDTVKDSLNNVLAPASAVFRNRIINGAMVIDQRNAGASVTIPATTVTYTVDRFYAYGTQASKFTVQQNAGSVTPPTGYTNYLGVTSSSAYAVTSTDQFIINQAIEGYNASDLAWGTANAKTVTLSFQVYSSLTGTFAGGIINGNSNRSYPFTFSIPTANTWTPISVTIAGDTTGTWATTNTAGINITFSLGAGSTFQSTANTWAAGNYKSVSGATSVVGTSGATFYLTAVQLEVGTNASNFDYRPYGTELALCERYYQSLNPISVFSYFSGASQSIIQNYTFPVTMRAAPTVTITSNGTTSNFSSIGNLGTTVNGASIQVVGAGAGQGGCYNAVGNAAIEL